VAYDADPNTGVSVYNSYAGGGWGQWGGTSIGAPQWAALIAIADQGRSKPLSSADTLNGLYALLSSGNTINRNYFHDITRGSSGTYSAAPGYDLVTGLGSPLANRLVPYLRGISTAFVAPNAFVGDVAPVFSLVEPLQASTRVDLRPSVVSDCGLSSCGESKAVESALWEFWDDLDLTSKSPGIALGVLSPESLSTADEWQQACAACFAESDWVLDGRFV
jgi:hypothetical protein